MNVIDRKYNVKNSVMPADAGRLHALSIRFFSVFEMVRRCVRKFCINMGNGFPVTKVIRTQDNRSGHKMHCCADHIIRIFHADYIHIRVITWNNRGWYFFPFSSFLLLPDSITPSSYHTIFWTYQYNACADFQNAAPHSRSRDQVEL